MAAIDLWEPALWEPALWEPALWEPALWEPALPAIDAVPKSEPASPLQDTLETPCALLSRSRRLTVLNRGYCLLLVESGAGEWRVWQGFGVA